MVGDSQPGSSLLHFLWVTSYVVNLNIWQCENKCLSWNVNYNYIIFPQFTDLNFWIVQDSISTGRLEPWWAIKFFAWHQFYKTKCFQKTLFFFSCTFKRKSRWLHLIFETPPVSSVTAVFPPGFHAATPVGKWVHAPGISPESPEKGGGQEDALPRFHHERMASQIS